LIDEESLMIKKVNILLDDSFDDFFKHSLQNELFILVPFYNI